MRSFDPTGPPQPADRDAAAGYARPAFVAAVVLMVVSAISRQPVRTGAVNERAPAARCPARQVRLRGPAQPTKILASGAGSMLWLLAAKAAGVPANASRLPVPRFPGRVGPRTFA